MLSNSSAGIAVNPELLKVPEKLVTKVFLSNRALGIVVRLDVPKNVDPKLTTLVFISNKPDGIVVSPEAIEKVLTKLVTLG